MFFLVEVLWCLTVVQMNLGLPVQAAMVVEHNVPLVASGQRLIRVLQPILVG
jgi:hypothetical protein